MTSKLRIYWFIFWKFRQLQLMRALELRGDFYFWAIVQAIWTVFNFFFFSLITQVSGHIGSWTLPEMYVLISIFTILDAFTWSFFYHNMWQYTQSVFSGQLALHLLRPIDTQFIVMVQNNSYSNILRFILGIAMLVWSVQAVGRPVSLPQVVGFTLIFACSLLLIYCIWFGFATLSFWVEKLNNINDIIPALRRFWQVPREVYTGVASFLFTVCLPIGLISSLPAEVILGKASWGWIGYFVALTIFFFVATRWFFHLSLRKFVGVGG